MKKKFTFLHTIVAILFCVASLTTPEKVSAAGYCFAEAEKLYNIDRRILYAISIVESQGNNSAIRINENKSTDKGHMQINSWWNFTKEELADPCFQTLAGAAILKNCFNRYKNGADAIACYNTGKSLNELTNKRKQAAKRYVAKVYSRIVK